MVIPMFKLIVITTMMLTISSARADIVVSQSRVESLCRNAPWSFDGRIPYGSSRVKVFANAYYCKHETGYEDGVKWETYGDEPYFNCWVIEEDSLKIYTSKPVTFDCMMAHPDWDWPKR